MDRIEQVWDMYVEECGSGELGPQETFNDEILFAKYAIPKIFDKQLAANCVMATLEKLNNSQHSKAVWQVLDVRDKNILMEQMCSAVYEVLRKATQ